MTVSSLLIWRFICVLIINNWQFFQSNKIIYISFIRDFKEMLISLSFHSDKNYSTWTLSILLRIWMLKCNWMSNNHCSTQILCPPFFSPLLIRKSCPEFLFMTNPTNKKQMPYRSAEGINRMVRLVSGLHWSLIWSSIEQKINCQDL